MLITVVYDMAEDTANHLINAAKTNIELGQGAIQACYQGDAMAERDALLEVLKKAVIDYKSCRASVEEMDMGWIAEAEQLIRQ